MDELSPIRSYNSRRWKYSYRLRVALYEITLRPPKFFDITMHHLEYLTEHDPLKHGTSFRTLASHPIALLLCIMLDLFSLPLVLLDSIHVRTRP